MLSHEPQWVSTYLNFQNNPVSITICNNISQTNLPNGQLKGPWPQNRALFLFFFSQDFKNQRCWLSIYCTHKSICIHTLHIILVDTVTLKLSYLLLVDNPNTTKMEIFIHHLLRFLKSNSFQLPMLIEHFRKHIEVLKFDRRIDFPYKFGG